MVTVFAKDLLMHKVKAHDQTSNRNLPKPPEVRRAWEEVGVNVSSSSGITRMAEPCRKRYTAPLTSDQDFIGEWHNHFLLPQDVPDHTSI